jgi:hypothetical protein
MGGPVSGAVMSGLASQVIQLAGAVLILAAFAGAQVGWLGHKSVGYLLTNMVGSAGLAVVAVPGRQWGFLLLEGSWSITSLVGVVTVLTRPTGDEESAQRPGVRGSEQSRTTATGSAARTGRPR